MKLEENPIILAAGKGTRMWPLTSSRPKPTLPVGGEPLICRHLRILARYYRKITVVVGYMSEKLINTINSCNTLNLSIKYIKQEEEKGTGHALLTALPKIREKAKSLLIIYADTYLSESDYVGFLEGNAEIGVASVDEPWNYGVLEIKNGLVRHIVEKPKRGTEPSNLIYAGILRLKEDPFETLKHAKPSPRGEIEIVDVIEDIAKKRGLSYHLFEKWIDVGRPWDLLTANKHALEEAMENNCSDRECKVMNDTYGFPSILYSGMPKKIDERAVIEGPAYIGKGVTIRPYAFLRPYNSLMPDSLVGSHVEVKASILLEGSKVPHLSYVGDSVIGENANLGAGTITANFRFDGRQVKSVVKGKKIETGLRKFGAIIGANVRTGINVSLLPGVKIGVNSWIYPGCIVSSDIPDNTILKCDQQRSTEILERLDRQ